MYFIISYNFLFALDVLNFVTVGLFTNKGRKFTNNGENKLGLAECIGRRELENSVKY